MHAGKDSAAKNDPKLFPKDSSPNNMSPDQNIVCQTQSEAKKNGPEVTGVQLVMRNQHLQPQCEKAPMNPQRQELVWFGSLSLGKRAEEELFIAQ